MIRRPCLIFVAVTIIIITAADVFVLALTPCILVVISSPHLLLHPCVQWRSQGGQGAMPPKLLVNVFFWNELMLLHGLNV